MNGKIMIDIIDSKFSQWTLGKDLKEARIAIFENIRDIPYAVIPDLIDPNRYVDMLQINKGSCTPKHFLLCEMYRRLGLEVFYVTYPFRWDEFDIEYPPGLKEVAERLPTSHHLACRVNIEGNLVLVDATLDLPLEVLGLCVNKEWNGISDTLLPMIPHGDEELYHPLEAQYMQAHFDEDSLSFYQDINSWLEALRTVIGAQSCSEL